MKQSLVAIALLVFMSPEGGCAAAPQHGPSAARSTVPLTIVSRTRTHRFMVRVARTADEQSRGLMFVKRLAADEGMIFPMEPPRFASFWMKNTLIPLDMIFVRPDGTIANIAENTVPHSLAPVTSNEPVAAVLEIAGGRAAQLGIRPGDKVDWRKR